MCVLLHRISSYFNFKLKARSSFRLNTSLSLSLCLVHSLCCCLWSFQSIPNFETNKLQLVNDMSVNMSWPIFRHTAAVNKCICSINSHHNTKHKQLQMHGRWLPLLLWFKAASQGKLNGAPIKLKNCRPNTGFQWPMTLFQPLRNHWTRKHGPAAFTLYTQTVNTLNF